MLPAEYESKLGLYDKSPMTLWYYGLGLAGEAGETVDKIKKIERDHLDVNDNDLRLHIAYELGDTLWYLTRLANRFGYTLEDIMSLNIDKLESRRSRGVLHGAGDNR